MRMGKLGLLAGGIVGVAVAIAVVTHLLAPADVGPIPQLANGRLSAPAAPGGDISLDPAPDRTQLSEIDRLIRAYDRQATGGENASSLAFLGRLELERARLTADVDSYGAAVQALQAANTLAPQDLDTAVALAGARYTTHDFTGALSLARGVLAENDASTGALAVEGDAQLELGRYDEATATYRQLQQAAPTAAAILVRMSRLSFLNGDVDSAERLAAQADTEATTEGAFGPKLAFYFVYHGKLELDLGHYAAALPLYEHAVRVAPTFYVALSGLGAAEAANGSYPDAIRTYRRAVRIVPDPISLAALGDLYTLTGKTRAAEVQYGTVQTIATIAALNRQLYDRQLALFYADHNREIDQAVQIAGDSLQVRKDIYGYDADAWALYRAGRFVEARAASDQALSLGTHDPKLWYHAGMIAAAQGDDARARDLLGRALGQSPHFDPLQSRRAAAELQRLGGAA